MLVLAASACWCHLRLPATANYYHLLLHCFCCLVPLLIGVYYGCSLLLAATSYCYLPQLLLCHLLLPHCIVATCSHFLFLSSAACCSSLTTIVSDRRHPLPISSLIIARRRCLYLLVASTCALCFCSLPPFDSTRCHRLSLLVATDLYILLPLLVFGHYHCSFQLAAAHGFSSLLPVVLFFCHRLVAALYPHLLLHAASSCCYLMSPFVAFPVSSSCSWLSLVSTRCKTLGAACCHHLLMVASTACVLLPLLNGYHYRNPLLHFTADCHRQLQQLVPTRCRLLLVPGTNLLLVPAAASCWSSVPMFVSVRCLLPPLDGTDFHRIFAFYCIVLRLFAFT